jgi:hypothetical protein
MASCAASAVVAFVIVGIWMITRSAPQDLFRAEAVQFFAAVGGAVATITFTYAVLLSLFLFFAHGTLLALLRRSFIRYIIAGLAMAVLSVVIMWSLGFPPPDQPEFGLAVMIACVAGPAASATFWVSTRQA